MQKSFSMSKRGHLNQGPKSTKFCNDKSHGIEHYIGKFGRNSTVISKVIISQGCPFNTNFPLYLKSMLIECQIILRRIV